jgi:hypothetical protein
MILLWSGILIEVEKLVDQNDNLAKLWVDETVSWCNGKLMK